MFPWWPATCFRCNRAITRYDIDEAKLTFLKDSVYESNDVTIMSRQKPAELFQSFEDWTMGTVGWTVDQVRL